METSSEAILWVGRIAGVGGVIAWLELTFIFGVHKPNLMRWNVSRLRHRFFCAGAPGVLAEKLQQPLVFCLACISGLAGSCGLVLAQSLGAAAAVSAGLSCLATLILFMRTPFGLDGADQMNMIVFVSLFIAHLSDSPGVWKVCLIFVAGQVTLSYVIAGLAKLISPNWRNSQALSNVLRTESYGAPHLAAFFEKRPTVAALATVTLIAFETGFPMVYFLPDNVAYAYLLAGVAFHLSAAVFMGLNVFLWSFCSCYPAVLFLRSSGL